jgi:ethanolamine permease
MLIGIVALFTGRTSEIITLAVFGALTLYVISMIALLTLRKTEPELTRPFKVPMYPAFPIIALVIASVSLIAMVIYNPWLAVIYIAIVGVCFGMFKLKQRVMPVTETKRP